MEFGEFYEALYARPEGPFPWQKRVAARVIQHGWCAHPESPESGSVVLDLPTASGKTTVLDIALFHLIHQLDAGVERTAALRLFFIVDRRIVVDGAFQHARRLANRLATAADGPLKHARELLCDHFGLHGTDDRPVHVSIMRGGLFRDDGWTRSPVQPTICVSTVDQVGSRLLFRGYGVSPSMRPIHAGLVANDSLLLIDEAHLSEPFLQTLDRVRELRCEPTDSPLPRRPLQFVRMSATNAESDSDLFHIEDDDREHPVLRPRLEAQKTATFDKVQVDKDDPKKADRQFCQAVVSRALRFGGFGGESEDKSPKTRRKKKARPKLESSSKPVRVIGIVVNRVRTARQIHQTLSERFANENQDAPADVILLTGRIRPFDRDELLFRKRVQDHDGGWLQWIAANRKHDPERPVFVVATQTVEVGADISFDALVTEAAPLDCLRQRFGRLDRLGRRRQSEAVIVGRSTAVAKNAEDAVYGKGRIGATWAWLNSRDVAKGSGKSKAVDFGLNAMEQPLSKLDSKGLMEMLAPRESAPFLQTPYAEIWSRTNPAPAADPDVTRFLHGNESRPPDVQVVWRADLLNHGEDQLRRDHLDDYVTTVALVPPTRMEACSVPVWELKRLLNRAAADDDSSKVLSSELADVEGGTFVDDTNHRSSRGSYRLALVWRGGKTRRQRRNQPARETHRESELVDADGINPGDTVVIPASYGGCDEFGWCPASQTEVKDVAEGCVRWSRGRPLLRLHPDVLAGWSPDCPALPDSDDAGTVDVLLNDLAQIEDLPRVVVYTLEDLRTARRNWRLMPYELQSDESENARPFPAVLIGRERVGIDRILQESQDAVEDVVELNDVPDEDDARCFLGRGEPVGLDDHTSGVMKLARQFAKRAGFSEQIIRDVKVATEWHDLGKVELRFQAMLHDGDVLEAVLAMNGNRFRAKSGIPFNDRAARRRAKSRAGVPDNFRHEALSVMLLRLADSATLESATDRKLIEFLVGSHHGFGRPFFPVCFDEYPPDIDVNWREQSWLLSAETLTPQELYRIDSGWSDLLAELHQRYGFWGLAWLEATFRLADHTQSAHEESGNTTSQQEVATHV